MDEAGNTTESNERELTNIKQIFYPVEPNVILDGFSEATSTISFRADVIKSGKKKKNKTPRREVRFGMLQYLAEVASNNLVYLFATKEKGSVQYLLFYRSKEDAERSRSILHGQSISTKFGPTQTYSELGTDAHKIKCVPPPVADCYQFMLKRLKVLHLPGSPTSKQLLRPIFCQRKRDIIECKNNTQTALPANDTAGMLELEDDDSYSDSALSSRSSRSNTSSDRNLLEPVEGLKDGAVDGLSDHSRNAETPIDQMPAQTNISQLNHDERTIQLRYWGLSKDTDTVRCTLCALEGHISRYCPSLKCPICHAFQQHSSDACPTYQICTKCREHGHRKENCPSKLARTTADGFTCHRCNQNGHTEETCSTLWQSYKPSTKLDIVKVDSLLVSCYQCGLNDHWGDDCKIIPKRKTIINTNNVFSANSANLYLIEPMKPPAKTNSSSRYHDKTSYSGDEDEQNWFYKNKRPKQASHSTIKIRTASNIPKASSQNSSKYQSYTNSERSNLTAKRHKPYPSNSPHTNKDQPKYRQGLPVDTYWRSGSVWQPPLPPEPLPSPSLYKSYEGQHQLPDKQQRGKQQKGYSYSRNHKNY